MTEIKMTDAASLSGSRLTADGYLVADVLCARTGCQDYLARELGLIGDGIVTVYRPESAVFDKASMATFAGKPVTMGHPSEAVTADNWKTYAVGDIGEEVARDGEAIRVQIKLMDGPAIADVQAGTREISMGYTTPIKMQDGTAPDGTAYQAIQTGPIRINHLAIVDRARGGSSLRIGDAAEQWGAAPLIPKGKDPAMADTNLTAVVLGDKAVNVTASDAATIEAFKAVSAKAIADAKAESDKVLAAKDAELATKDSEIAALKAKVLDAAAIDALVKDRADLVAKAKAIAPEAITDGKSSADIKKAVVVAKRGATMADKSEAYIDAAFDLLADADPVKAALADTTTTKVSDAYQGYTKKLTDAWKGEGK